MLFRKCYLENVILKQHEEHLTANKLIDTLSCKTPTETAQNTISTPSMVILDLSTTTSKH